MLSALIQQLIINRQEEKILSDICKSKDTSGEGYLRMDDLREAFYEYNGRFIEKEEID